MAFDAHKNLASSTVATAPAPPGTGSTLVVAAGHGVRFPVAPFEATVWPSAAAPTLANAEIVRVTSVATDTFQIIRAQGGTTARAIGVGDLIAASITAKTLTDVETEFAAYARLNAINTFSANQIVSMATPSIIWTDTSQPANSRGLSWVNTAQQMILMAVDDTNAMQTAPIVATRPGDLKAWRDLYEKQRATPLGHWQNLTPTVGAPIGSAALNTNVAYRYTLIGKTLILVFFLQITVSGSPTIVTLNFPAGLTSAEYAVVPYTRGNVSGTARCDPSGTVVNLLNDVAGTLPWAAETLYVAGTVTASIL